MRKLIIGSVAVIAMVVALGEAVWPLSAMAGSLTAEHCKLIKDAEPRQRCEYQVAHPVVATPPVPLANPVVPTPAPSPTGSSPTQPSPSGPLANPLMKGPCSDHDVMRQALAILHQQLKPDYLEYGEALDLGKPTFGLIFQMGAAEGDVRHCMFPVTFDLKPEFRLMVDRELTLLGLDTSRPMPFTFQFRYDVERTRVTATDGYLSLVW